MVVIPRNFSVLCQQTGSEAYWMSRWERADDAGKREMSKMFEYYWYALAYRGYKFGNVDVVDLMLTQDQYTRFHPTEAKPPSYWLPLIREQTPTSTDLERFQRVMAGSSR